MVLGVAIFPFVTGILISQPRCQSCYEFLSSLARVSLPCFGVYASCPNKGHLLILVLIQFSFSLVALSLSAARLQRLDEHAGSTLNYTPWDRVAGKPYELPDLYGLPRGQFARYGKILNEVLVASLFTCLWALYACVTVPVTPIPFR